MLAVRYTKEANGRIRSAGGAASAVFSPQTAPPAGSPLADRLPEGLGAHRLGRFVIRLEIFFSSWLDPMIGAFLLGSRSRGGNMQHRVVKVVSNMRGFAQVAQAGRIEVTAAARGLEFLRHCRDADLVVLDDQKLLLAACLIRPFCKFRLVSVDLILRPPRDLRSHVACAVKRLMLAQVDRFVLYFKNLAGYDRFYGVDAGRTVYVPFKVNGWEQRSRWPARTSAGDYVLCAGRTLRDVATFVHAMRKTGCPGIILQEPARLLREHGTSAWTGELPSNVRLEMDETGGLERLLGFLAGARLVVIPRFRWDIASTGISTYLMAMALGTCVILSRGPGADDVLTDQAALVEPENPDELAQAIHSLWHNASARGEIAERGRLYAHGLAGEDRLCADVLRSSLPCLAVDGGGIAPAPAA